MVGGVAGAAIGAISKATQDAGISKEQLETIRTQITEGTSALVRRDGGRRPRPAGRAPLRHGQHAVATNLTDAERAVLLETFGS